MEHALDIINAGIVLIIVGFLLVFIGTLKHISSSETNSEFAFVGFIGPIPFGFGSSKQAIIFALALMVLIFLLLFLWVKRFA